MNNFGVIEVATSKTKHAPGWAYVPDSGPNPSAFAAPTSRKNRAARNQGGLGLSDLTARQDAKLRKELEALDKEPGSRDVPVPVKGGGARAANKHTPNVRKILMSQKTFANHLDDWIALGSQEGTVSTPAAGTDRAAKRGSTAQKGGNKGRTGSTSTTKISAPKTKPKAEEPQDTDMPDADGTVQEAQEEKPEQSSYPPDGTILPAYNRPPPRPHPGDHDPLLVSRIVPFPKDEELKELLTAPPLSYLDARAGLDGETMPPPRKFCEVCGYWGRVKCGKCGGRVCALDCLETHREECVRRYGL
jgi:zinc finger HIT domain-containing protein 1